MLSRNIFCFLLPYLLVPVKFSKNVNSVFIVAHFVDLRDSSLVPAVLRIRDELPGSYFLELRNHFFGLKYLKSLMRIRDGKNLDPGSGLEKSQIRDPGQTSRIRNTMYLVYFFG